MAAIKDHGHFPSLFSRKIAIALRVKISRLFSSCEVNLKNQRSP
ncbi:MULTISPECIES: hypothetical protein [unclassified Tolypothrix]|nr:MULTISPECIES: hypothetical protein [unclassified Tolypothrix]EKF01533.1 hypothetical protein FDUTEX481_07668 [Tolypothrix sp. PCC 7601]